MKKSQKADTGSDEMLLSEKIWRSLADDISAGLIAPGTLLDEQQLAVRFGTSRTPVREAVRKLAAEKLVEIRPRRGAIVIEMSIDHLSEMLEMSAEFEALCVRLATYRMMPLERARLHHVHERAHPFVEANDEEGYSPLYVAFHRLIAEATHNSYIAEQVRLHTNRMMAFRRIPLFKTYTIQRAYDEHKFILDAIMRGDGEEAARRMRAHVYAIASSLEASH